MRKDAEKMGGFYTENEFNIERLSPILGDNYKQTFLYGATNIFTFSGIASGFNPDTGNAFI